MPEVHPPAESFIPPRATLAALQRAAQRCTACDLYKWATQAVLGAGPRPARAMLVGEQPGDQEDLQGKPFVGPAGRVLDEVLVEAGIPRDAVFVTNAVKHFKFVVRSRVARPPDGRLSARAQGSEPRGKRRLHQKPTLGEVRACRPWLEAEIELVHPEGIVCLGATAAQGFLGSAFRITRERGRFFDTPYARWVTATLHPSAILRMPDPAARREARAQLVADLEQVAARLRAA
ncbi:MAG TPA: uracil-DNA glycosylase family protein [Thermoanaerobaculia bacterium]|nr:uracil-DNA glycosylase family protein [Thermoanaerobaculia bacterium]